MPVGRRLAFDVRQGRLWVVCRSCVKWNLVPFETRLEVIDACERIFRATHTRFSTDNIGLAVVADELELVRIGPALRPEFAAWRYGKDLLRRRMPAWRGQARRRGPPSSIPGHGNSSRCASRPSAERNSPWTIVARWQLEVPYRLEGETGGPAELFTLFPSIRDVPGLGLFRNEDLFPTLGRIMPAIDPRRAHPDEVSSAVKLVEQVAAAHGLFPYVVGRPLKFAISSQLPAA